MSAPKLAARLYVTSRRGITAHTVRNRLHAADLRGRNPYVGVPLAAQHRYDRLNWATHHRHWRNFHWNNVLLTDKPDLSWNSQTAVFEYGVVRGSLWHCQRCPARSIRRREHCSKWRNGFGYYARNIECCEILPTDHYTQHVIPYVLRHSAKFQHDNARCHTARHNRD